MNQEEELNPKHNIWSELLIKLAVLVLPNGNGGAATAAIFWKRSGAFAGRSRTGDGAMRTSSFDGGAV